MLLDGLLLLFAGVFVFVLLALRGVLSLTLPRSRAQLLPDDYQPPASVADLFAQKHAVLTRMGFTERHWLLYKPQQRQPGESKKLGCVWLHPSQAGAVYGVSPADISAPNRLSMLAVSVLADGRLLLSARNEPLLEMMADGELFVAQTLPDVPEDELWQAHCAWRQKIDVADVQPGPWPALQTMVEAREAKLLEKLMMQGKLWQDARGGLRLALRFACRLLVRYFLRPKHRPDIQPVPFERLRLFMKLWLASQQSQLPRRWQWLMLGVSSCLFVLIGGWFFGFAMAALVLAILLFHEGGHYLAMRLCGYHNVQMLAIPPLGGVTLGVERKPMALHRAWISLLGPLPGIVLGWVLLGGFFYWKPGEVDAEWGHMLLWPGVMLLVINYLNLIPAKPLDGGHLLQALLPPRWLIVTPLILMVGGMLGLAVGWYLSSTLLLVIFGLSFVVSVPQALTQRSIVNELLMQPETENADRNRLRDLVLHTLWRKRREATEGKAGRINIASICAQAEEISNMLIQKPLEGTQRILLTGIYLLLLLVPVVLSFTLWGFSPLGDYALSKEDIERGRILFERSEALRAQAQTLPSQVLLEQLAGEALSDPASDEALAAAAQRLRQPLPQALRQFYNYANGIESLHMLQVERIGWLSQQAGWQTYVQMLEHAPELLLSYGESVLPLNPAVADWIYVGGDFRHTVLLYQPKPQEPDMVMWFSECDQEGFCMVWDSLDAWLREQWLDRQMSQMFQEE